MSTVSEEERIRRLIKRLDVRDLLGLLRKICKDHKTTLEDVLAKKRQPYIVLARTACIHALLDIEGFSSVVVGGLLGIDHSTVLVAKGRAGKRST